MLAVVSSVKSNWMLLVAEQQGAGLQVGWQGGQRVGYQQASFCDTKLGIKLVWSIGGATRRDRLDEGKRISLCGTYRPFLPPTEPWENRDHMVVRARVRVDKCRSEHGRS